MFRPCFVSLVENVLHAKGTKQHDAAVVGDTVGDPLKDTSGPSLNILVKLMAIISLVFAPSFPAIGSSGLLGMAWHYCVGDHIFASG
jgi:K(+)-stimulated pyrophosphate-energized sodium pump